MEITGVDVVLDRSGKLEAWANVEFDHCFRVRSLKVINLGDRYLVAMPNREGRNGMFRDVCHPTNSEFRVRIENAVLERFFELKKERP